MQLTVGWLNFTMSNQTVKNGLKAKKIKLPQMNFFSRKTTNKSFMYLSAPFILQNFLKTSQSYEDKHHFREENGLFVLNKNFLVQTIVITFIYLLALFIVQKFKKWSIFPKQFFFENYNYHSHLPISPFHCAKF